MSGLLITGDTYPHRRELAALGGKWSRSREAWVIPARSREAATALAEAHGLRVYTEDDLDPAELGPITEAERRANMVQKLERKAARLEAKAERRTNEARALIDGIPSHETDYAWLTQPVVGRSDVQRFVRRRDKIAAAMTEAKEADRAANALSGAVDRMSTPAFAYRRLEEARAELAKLRRSLAAHGDNDPAWSERVTGEYIPTAEDKIAYWDAEVRKHYPNGLPFGPHNVKRGDLVLCRHGWCVVFSVGPKNVKVEFSPGSSWGLPYPWIEVTGHESKK